MTEENNIQRPVLILSKNEIVLTNFYYLVLLFGVITFKIRWLSNKFNHLLTFLKSRFITLQRFVRLSIRFLNQKSTRMIQFSFLLLKFEISQTDNRAAEAFYCLSACSAYSHTKFLPNIY
jgi:hypothetical protein